MKYVPLLGDVVIACTEGYIRGLGSDFNSINIVFTGQELLDKYHQTLKEAIELYRKTLKEEQMKMLSDASTPQETIDNLLRSIIITSELVKIEQMIEERYNAREKDNI